MSAPEPLPPYGPDEPGFERLENPEPVHRIRSFVSGDPAGTRLRVAFWRHVERGEVRARVWFGPDAEGPPGHAHGGSLAAVLDEVMGVAAWHAGHSVVLGRLTVDYKRPLPLMIDTITFAEVRSVAGRRVEVHGRIESEPGVVHTSAVGIFVVVDPEKLGVVRVP